MAQQFIDPVVFSLPAERAPEPTIKLSEQAKQGNENVWGELKLIPPESRAVSTKERLAINRALEEAYNSKDPVRWILVRARGEFLQMSSKQYAPEIGLAPHTLTTKEQKTSDKVAPSTYSHFFEDWAKRAVNDSAHGHDFARSYKLLMFYLLREEYFGITGLIKRWQCHVGAADFAARTGIDPKIIHSYKKCGFNPSFGELVDIAKRAKLISPKQSSGLWSNPVVVQARRVFIHESLKRGRSPSAVLLRCAMELSAESSTDATMQRNFPNLSRPERRTLLNYDPLESKAYSGVISELIKRGILDQEEGQRLIGFCARERKRVRSLGVAHSVQIVEKKMREQGFDNLVLRSLLGELPVPTPREALSHIRKALYLVEEGSRITPFGVLACLVAESKEELKGILQARRAEMCDRHMKRFGTQLSRETMERRLWGFDENDLKRAEGNIFDAAEARIQTSAVPALRRLLLRGVSDPQEFVAQALRDFSNNEIAHCAKSSAPMLSRIGAGSVYPHLSLYRRIVEAAHSGFTPYAELQWHDGFSRRQLQKAGKSEFGSMQSRITDAIVAARGESRREFLINHATVPDAARASRALLRLDRNRDLPLVLFKQVLSAFCIKEDSPDGAAIGYLLRTKNYPAAIQNWFKDGMPCATQEIKDAATRVIESSVENIAERVRYLPHNLTGLMAIREKRSPRVALGKRAVKKNDDELLVEASLTLLRVFPGAGLEHIETVRANLQKEKAKKP